MTFDEVLEKISNLQGSAGYASGGDVVTPIFSPLEVNDLLTGIADMVEELRQEYAPTIEMTKEQKEYYGSRTLLSGMSFLGNTRYYTDDVHTITREISLAILHPETIKVMEEK